jgi:hypothetical protein
MAQSSTDSQPAGTTISSRAQVLIYPGMIALLFASYIFWGHVDAAEEKKQHEQAQEVSAVISDTFARMVHTAPGADGASPSMVWKGADSKLLHVDSFIVRKPLGSEIHTWAVLGVTKRGRYFLATWQLPEPGRCSGTGPECVSLRSVDEMSEKSVRDYLFARKRPDLYEQLFKEKMPPATIDA